MPISESLLLGAYLAGDSCLHRLDPRLKILLLLALMLCLFSAASPLRLLGIFLLWLAAAGGCPAAIRSGLGILRWVRWLLLFTLLLHLCFTPGRTLFGTGWLSYDGLLRGLLVDAQVILALLFSSLLCWTTRPTELAWGLARILSPLRRFRLPTPEIGGMLLLVLHFIPVIQEELSEVRRQSSSPGGGRFKKLQEGIGLVEPLLLRLFDRADRLAQRIVTGDNPLQVDDGLLDGRFRRIDPSPALAGCLVLVLLWML
jgi:energy-coupling factor transport system permease protein